MIQKKIIAVDCDNTLTNEICYTPEECLKATPKDSVIEKIAKLYNYNFVIIYTARRDNLIPSTLEWLRRNNIRYHALSNLKIPSDYYIDDLAIALTDIDKLISNEETD
jgi:hypothetical protein